jgi:type IV pilus assembly protein PilP
MKPTLYRYALVLASATVLAACGGEEHSDLKSDLEKLTKDLRGRVDPLPLVQPYKPVPYEAEKEIDPFRPARIEVAQSGQAVPSASSARIKQEQERPKEPLEAFPLETLKMVGTLERGRQMYALVRADSGLYRVRVGNYLGQNFGVITKISNSEVALRELVQDAGGDWAERESTLLLQEADVKEAKK